MHTFGDATGVAPAGEERFVARIPETWNVPAGIHGGVLCATTLRAAREALNAPELAMRTAHGSFYARPSTADLVIETRTIRRGGTTAHVEAHSRSPADPGAALALRALFTRRRDGPHHLDAAPPAVPAPDRCPPDATGDDESPLSRPPLFDQLDLRRARGTFPWAAEWQPGLPLVYSRWGRYLDRPEMADGTYDPLALLPLADLPGPSVWVHFGPGEPLRLLVSLELTIHFLEPVPDDWVLADFRARWLGDGYALSECDLWSDGRLVAVATQAMMLRVRPDL